ncbi:autophagy-related protein 18-like isoform X2 [Rosa rugosa]|uniref:autophagy-related protein 18-like isoform X2 n=1 Tax=Rosa rugosa TaxID=74645 RepID=UPI002B4060DB|nr:autophagy-related protein 18-like isoform X2 [Rosa rugosa]
MLFSSSLLAIVGAGEEPSLSPRRHCLFNTTSGTALRELNFLTSILSVRMNRKRATKDDQSTEYQKHLMEEEQKVEVLKLRLKIEKERNRSQANEMASLRAAKDEEIMEYRKLLMEEKQKRRVSGELFTYECETWMFILIGTKNKIFL